MGIFDSLGMDAVEADPNAIPDGRYAGVVQKSEHVVVAAKNEVSHVITYKVTHGVNKGAQISEWFLLGTAPELDENKKLVSFTPGMRDTQRPWYKKRFIDLGIPENAIAAAMETPESLTGTPVTFGVKKNGAYRNVSFVEYRGEEDAPETSGTAVTGLL